MKSVSILLIILLAFTACKSKQEETQEKFDRNKWAERQELKYPYRDKMLNDLLASYDTLHGLKPKQILYLLGEPNRKDSNYYFYTVDQEFIAGSWPLRTKTMVIKFGVDSAVQWTKIHE